MREQSAVPAVLGAIALGLVLLVIGIIAALVAASSNGDTEETLEGLESQLDTVAVDAAALTTSQAVYLPDPPPGQITLKLDFVYQAPGLPGQLTVHEPGDDANRLFAMESLAAGTAIPMGGEIEDGIIFVNPGELKLVELVYRNPDPQASAFMAIAPSFDPVAAHPFAYARCFCAAIRFEAPPGGSWYRTIAVGAAAPVPPGTKVIVTWPVIPVD